MSEEPLHDDLSPQRLWSSLDAPTKALAARALYAHDWDDALPRREADVAICRALRFREAAVRQLSIDKRVDYLVRMIRPDESLASSLLLALHLESRRPLLCAFLDALGLPHQDGLIDGSFDLTPLPAGTLTPAVASVRERFPREEVETYFRTLLALDPDTWAALREVLA
jgi:hypothetical protein